MRDEYRFTAPRRARKGNLVLLPGSVLPQMERCAKLANALPAGGVLLVVPVDNPKQKRALLIVAKLLAQEGHPVKVISTIAVTRHTTPPQISLDL